MLQLAFDSAEELNEAKNMTMRVFVAYIFDEDQ